jgi:hypothetical protein
MKGFHESSRGGYSENDSIKDWFSSSSLSCWAKRFVGSESIQFTGDYSRQSVNFYGGSPGIQQLDDSSERLYNVWATHLEIKNIEAKKIQHHFKASYQFLHEQGLHEHNFDLGLSLKTDISLRQTDDKKTLKTVPLTVRAHTNIDRFRLQNESNEAPNERQAIFDFHPSIQQAFRNIQTQLGFGLWIDAQGNKPFLVVPELEASTSLLRDLFIPYVKIKGGVKQNRYLTLANANPFLSNQTDSLNNTYEKIHLQAGMRGSITKTFTFNLSAHHLRFDQFLLWRPDNDNIRGETFLPLYLDMNQTTLQADASWRLGQSFTLTGQIQQNTYQVTGTPSSYLQPWNLPTFETQLGAIYTWQEKIRIASQLEVKTGRQSLQAWSTSELPPVYNGEEFVGYETSLGALTMLNVQIEYLYNGRLSGWVHLNNLLNQPNLFLPGYNSQRFRFQMGINYSF